MYSVYRGAMWSYAILSLISIAFTFIELNQPYETPEDAQSRFELHFQPIFTILMISASILAFRLHKRLHVFAGPIFNLLGGFWYLWVFMSFTIGWVRMQGFLGLGFSLIICFILIIYHLYTNLKNGINLLSN